MENIQSAQSKSIAHGDPPQRLAIILVRFLALLVIAIAILAIGWSRP